MPQKEIISVRCPCCKHLLEVDVEAEKVLAFRKGRHLTHDAREGEDPLDVAMRQKKEHDLEREKLFGSARERLKDQEQRLDSLFEEARDKARQEEDEGERPPRHGPYWD